MTRKQIHDNNLQRLNKLSLYLRELRFSAGETQEMVGNEILSRTSIVRLENSNNFHILTLFEIADYYGVPVSEIFSDIQ